MVNLPFIHQKQTGNEKPAANKADPKQTTPSTASSPDLSLGFTSVQDIIAPAAIEVDFTHLQIGQTYFRTLFVAGYPRYVNANWLSPLINFEHILVIMHTPVPG